MVASIYENIPGISDRASHSTRNRETDPAESLCSPGVPAEPHPTCTTQAERNLVRLRRACTATAFLRASECFFAGLPDFLPMAQPSTSGSDPRHRQVLLHRHFRSA